MALRSAGPGRKSADQNNTLIIILNSYDWIFHLRKAEMVNYIGMMLVFTYVI